MLRRLIAHHQLLLIALLAVLLLPGGVRVTAQSSRSVGWSDYAVTLEVRQDGRYHVTQQETIRFDGGPFHGGYTDLNLTRIDGIENVTFGELVNGVLQPYRLVDAGDFNDEAGTYSLRKTATKVEVNYGFGSFLDQTRILVTGYDVRGALRVYSDATPPNQQIWWTVVPTDVTDIGNVDHASMTIVLPAAVDPAQAFVGEGDQPSLHTSDGRTWSWERSNLQQGDSWEVRLQVPPVASANPPAWQSADDARRLAEQDRADRKALLNVIFLAIGLGMAALGGVAIYGLWYLKGRDPHTGLVAEYIPNPPDDLPAAAVGALIDETVDERDVIAAVADLGRRGVMTIAQTKAEDGVSGFGHDFTLTLTQPDAPLAPFEKTLLISLFGQELKAGAAVQLSQVKGRFEMYAPQITREIYDEIVRRGYFTTSPADTRRRWRRVATTGLVLVALAGVGAGVIVLAGVGFYWFALVIAALLLMVLIKISGRLPRKTEAGALAAAKWRAFQSYLKDIGRYEKTGDAQQILETNLAYAVAFGLETNWLNAFKSVGVITPAWLGVPGPGGATVWGEQWLGRGGRGGTVIVGRPGGHGRGAAPHGGGGANLPGMPDVQKTSDQAGKGLQSGSDSLFDLLNTAAKVFGSMSGGGGGGRHGGFGGGGRSGGASGGGGRGFH